jgi:hypothetical protein
MGIQEDSTIAFSQMLEWAQHLNGIKDHSNTPAETTNAYDADYKKRCVIRIANFHRSKRLKWLNNRLVNLNVDLKLARNEASHERVTALEIEIDVMKADKNVLESQTEEQRVAAPDALEEAQRVAKIAERDRKRAEKEAGEAQRVAKAAAKTAKRDAKWTTEVDASIESMLDDGVSFAKIASKLGNGLSKNDILSRWYDHLKESSSITKPPVQPGFPSRITWSEDADASIMRMRADGVSFAKIASELGNGLKTNDIKNRWNRHLKDK